MLDAIVCGAAGRMGATLVRLIHESRSLKLAGAVESPDNPQIGKDAGEVAGVGKLGVPIVAELEPLLKKQAVVIEFTAPAATLEHARIAARKNAPIVIGTTGLDPKQREEIVKLGRQGRILISANMSLGVNLLVSLMGKVAGVLGRSEEHTSELQSPYVISYAVFCL